MAKFPMAIGVIIYWFRRLARRPKAIIEYKGDARSAAMSRGQAPESARDSQAFST
jgi:hypothetical protein